MMATSRQPTRPNLYLRPFLLFTLLLGFGLRTFRLGHQELRGDETFGYFFSLPSFGRIVERTFELQEPHPVASYFIQSIWLDWAGHSEFALRFPSAWFSLLSVALLMRLAWLLGFDRTVIALGGTLAAISPYAIWHAQDARMYSMSLALTLASSSFCIALIFPDRNFGCKHLKNEPNQTDSSDSGGSGYARLPTLQTLMLAGGYLLTSWLALHTHYFAVFVIISQNLFLLIWMLMRPQSRIRTFLAWIGLQVLLSLAYLPWLISARSILTGYGGNGDSPGLLEMAGRATRTFTFGETIDDVWVWAAVALALFGLVNMLRESLQRAGFLLLYFLVPLAATWLSALQRPIFDERYLIAAAPPFLLLAALGLSAGANSAMAGPSAGPFAQLKSYSSRNALRLVSWVLAVIVGIGIMASLSNHYANPAYSKTIGWRQLAQTLDQLSIERPPERVRLIQNYPDPTLWYYYQGDVAHLVLPPRPADVAGSQREIEQLVFQDEPVEHLVFVSQPADNWDNHAIAQEVIRTEYTLIAKTTSSQWPVQVYAKPPDLLSAIDTGDFSNGLRLSQVAIEPLNLNRGGVLSIHLKWQQMPPLATGEGQSTADDAPNLSLGTEKLFLHLVGPENTLIAQHDTVLGPIDTIMSYGILIPDDAPEGSYRLIVGLYLPEQNGAPRVLTSNGADAVLLANLSLDAEGKY